MTIALIIGLIALLFSGLALFGLWILAFVQIIDRKDLEHEKWLWVVILLFGGVPGQIVFFFLEKRPNLGLWSLVLLISFTALLIAAFASLIMMSFT